MTVPLIVRLSLPRADFHLDVDLALPPQGITVLFGASGSGKTSVLRCVASSDNVPIGVMVLSWRKRATSACNRASRAASSAEIQRARPRTACQMAGSGGGSGAPAKRRWIRPRKMFV